MHNSTQVTFTKQALQDLKKLDKTFANRVVDKIEWYAQQKNPLHTTKLLKGDFAGLDRYRVGDYRVIFDYSNTKGVNVLLVLTIAHRREVYE